MRTSFNEEIVCATVVQKYIEKEHMEDIEYANVGGPRLILGPGEVFTKTIKKNTFEPIHLEVRKGPLVIHGKRWYFRLVSAKQGEFGRSRALMDDYKVNEIANHLVICFTPEQIPGQDKLFRNKAGEPIRIYAYFDCYLEYYEYVQKFEHKDRSFYEIVFGELPQKPHFDIDIDVDDFSSTFPADNIDTTADFLKDCVIAGCFEVLRDLGVSLDLRRDLLLYSSHGIKKRSYHVIINNKCHDGNQEAKAFYDNVMVKFHMYTQNKYRNYNIVDKSVYSPRQQFRIVGSQKIGSNRPKIFYEQFTYQSIKYDHIYGEDTTDITLKKLTIIYESMITFISGCAFIPSLVEEKTTGQNKLGEMADLSEILVDQCLGMLRKIMDPCPFVKKSIQGHLILLTRLAPSRCPICKKSEPHMNEHPYMFIIGGKLYWDCRRSPMDVKKLFVGYLDGMTLDLPIDGIEEEDEIGEFSFGDFKIGEPTMIPVKKGSPNKETTVLQDKKGSPNKETTLLPGKKGSPNKEIVEEKIIIPMDRRMQNIPELLLKMGRERANKKYIRNEAQDVMGKVSFDSIKSEIPWKTGLQ